MLILGDQKNKFRKATSLGVAFFYFECRIEMLGVFFMNKLKKILYFTLGAYLVPVCLGMIHILFLGVEDAKFFYQYFTLVYILVCLLSVFFYRGKIAEKFPNRYAFYGIMYLAFEVLGIGLYLL